MLRIKRVINYFWRIVKHKYFIARYMIKAFPLVEELGLSKSAWIKRMIFHDWSKLSPTEVTGFLSMGSGKKKYGTDKYYEGPDRSKGALQHHYRLNSHHPEHFDKGISQMQQIDELEMVCDWIAATHYNNLTSIEETLELSQERFAYSDPRNEKYKEWVIRIKAGK